MPSSLTLEDFSDHDLLFLVEEHADPEGWITSQDLAEVIDIRDHKYPAQCVGSRLSAGRRFGHLEKDVEKGQIRWRLTQEGYDLIHPKKLSAAGQRALDGMDESQAVEVLDRVSRDLPQLSRPAAHMARRAFKHNFGSWRDQTLTPRRA